MRPEEVPLGYSEAIAPNSCFSRNLDFLSIVQLQTESITHGLPRRFEPLFGIIRAITELAPPVRHSRNDRINLESP